MSNKKELSKIIPLFFALFAVIVCVPLRIYQARTIIDASTGFYNEINFTVYIVYALLAIAGVVAIAIPFARHNTLKITPICGKSAGYTVVALIFALTLIVDSASQLFDFLDLFSVTGYSAAYEFKSYISAQGGYILLIQAILGALSAVYFFVQGVTVGIGNTDTSKYRIFSLVPVLWSLMKLLYRFKRTISFVNVSDLLLELFLIVFTLMFLFVVAQINSKIDGNMKRSEFLVSIYWKIFAYGIPTAMLAIVCFLPRFILLITGHSDNINDTYPVFYSDFGLAVYAVFTCITALRAEPIKQIE